MKGKSTIPMATSFNPFGSIGLGQRISRIAFDKDDGADKGGGDAGKGDDEDNDDEITLKQSELDKMMKTRVARANGKSAKQIAELERQLEELKSKSGKPGDDDKGKTGDRQVELKALAEKEYVPQIQERDQRIKDLEKQVISSAISTAAAACGAHEKALKQIGQLLKGDLGFDEKNNLVVLDEDGEPKLGKRGAYVTVEEHVKAYLAENPHLCKAGGLPGTGSSTSNRGKQDGGDKRPGNMRQAAGNAAAKMQNLM